MSSKSAKRRKKRAAAGVSLQASAESRERSAAYERELQVRLDRELAESARRRADAWALSDEGTPYGGEAVMRKGQ